MITLYLLLLPLLVAVVESQSVNVTVEEPSDAEGNQTFRVSTDDNVTSTLYRDEKGHIEDELQHNQTSTTPITEDEEAFQYQERVFPHKHCQRKLLVEFGHTLCGEAFHKEMLTISTEHWCLLEFVTRPYNDVTLCLENLSSITGCYYPNYDTQDFFLFIHSHYFQNCTKEELPFEDAPHWVVMVLTLIPVSLIPVLVYLVVWKSKVQE